MWACRYRNTWPLLPSADGSRCVPPTGWPLSRLWSHCASWPWPQAPRSNDPEVLIRDSEPPQPASHGRDFAGPLRKVGVISDPAPTKHKGHGSGLIVQDPWTLETHRMGQTYLVPFQKAGMPLGAVGYWPRDCQPHQQPHRVAIWQGQLQDRPLLLPRSTGLGLCSSLVHVPWGPHSPELHAHVCL